MDSIEADALYRHGCSLMWSQTHFDFDGYLMSFDEWLKIHGEDDAHKYEERIWEHVHGHDDP
jgi:hypothetical protein